MIRGLTAAAAALLGTLALAQAAPQCFRPAELEAEEAVRFQVELMVVSETCRDGIYTRFTRRNSEVIAQYQHRMIEYFRRSGQPRAEASLDSYMTRVANETSLRTGAEPVAVVCRNAANLLATANSLGTDEFRRYVAARATERSHDYRRCTE